MAACGGLEHIFEKPLPENPTLLESLSPWKQIKSMKPVNDSSFTEIFGELHFKENNHHVHSPPAESSISYSFLSSSLSTNSTPSPVVNPAPLSGIAENDGIDHDKDRWSVCPSRQKKESRHSNSFSSMSSESLSLCTEGLGFESFDEVEDLLRNDTCNNEFQVQEERTSSFTRYTQAENNWGESKRSRTSTGEFPPPISCIGKNGRPWVCFKSFRQDGRFILKEIRIPTHEFLHACREDGRLRLRFLQSDDEILEEDDEDEDQDVDENRIDICENEDCDKQPLDQEGKTH